MGERTVVEAQSSVARKQEQRAVLFRQAKERFGVHVLNSGAYALGRNDKGETVDTKNLAALNIHVNRWLVRTVFKPDDLRRIERKDWHIVEEMEKEGTVPKRTITHENHIITATRALKHVRGKYERSMAEDNAAMDRETGQVLALYRLNLDIAEKKGATAEDIDAHIKRLQDFLPMFANARSALKHVVGMGRLQEALRRFEAARDAPPQKRAFVKSSACAVFASVNERLTTWKSKNDAGKNARTDGRESALRMERDRWLLAQFARFASNPQQAWEFAKLDSEKKEAMGVLRGKIEAAATLAKQLKRLRLPQRREAKEAELKKAISDAHRYFHVKKDFCTDNGRKPPSILAHHGWIDRYLLKRQFDNALKKVDYFVMFLDSNKPRFILDELSKDPDPYLERDVLPALRLAVEAFEKEDFKTAKEHFITAMKAMREIVHPQADRHENKNSLPYAEHIQKDRRRPDNGQG